MTRLQVADRSWFEELRAAYPNGASHSLSWEERIYVSAMRGVEAHILGDLEAANQLATELLVESAGELNSTHAAGGLLLAIARDAGGVAMLVPAVQSIAESNPRIAAFSAAFAAARVIAGDVAGSRAIVEQHAAAGFDNVPHEHVYLLYLGLISEAVALLDAAEYVEPLLELLAPYAGQMCVGAHGVVVLSSMDTYRGMLATVVGDPRGREWFEAGMEVEERLGAVLLRARTAAWKALWLRRHGEGTSEAGALIADARAVVDAHPRAAGLRETIDLLDTRA